MHEIVLTIHGQSNFTQYGTTALMWATINGHVEIAKFLIDNRTDVNIANQVYFDFASSVFISHVIVTGKGGT